MGSSSMSGGGKGAVQSSPVAVPQNVLQQYSSQPQPQSLPQSGFFGDAQPTGFGKGSVQSSPAQNYQTPNQPYGPSPMANFQYAPTYQNYGSYNGGLYPGFSNPFTQFLNSFFGPVSYGQQMQAQAYNPAFLNPSYNPYQVPGMLMPIQPRVTQSPAPNASGVPYTSAPDAPGGLNGFTYDPNSVSLG